MDLKQLEALGITAEELTNRIVDQAVESLLNASGYDPENDMEVRYESRFKKEIEKKILSAVDKKISDLAEKHLVPRVGEMIEQADMRETNRYGEPKSPPMSFKEFIAYRAESYMSEDVNYNGLSKAESGSDYNWKSSGPRLMVLMRVYIRETLESAAKGAVNDVNKVIASNIEKAAKDAIAATVANLKVAVAA